MGLVIAYIPKHLVRILDYRRTFVRSNRLNSVAHICYLVSISNDNFFRLIISKISGDTGDRLREAGGEYGAATGRPRRVGGFDVVASKYGVAMQGCDSIALTKLDVLSYLDRIPVCTAYEIDGRRVTDFPIGPRLERAKPLYEYLPGFRCDISGCRKVEDLPQEALQYVRYLESAVGCRIKYVSVGPDRNAYIKMF